MENDSVVVMSCVYKDTGDFKARVDFRADGTAVLIEEPTTAKTFTELLKESIEQGRADTVSAH